MGHTPLLITLVLATTTHAQELVPFTTEQAAAGLAAYRTHCATCHQTDLAGANEARPLAGPAFMSTWSERTVQQLLLYTQITMPQAPGIPNSLPEETYADITIFMLRANGAEPGTETLTADTTTTIGTIATGEMPAGLAAAVASAPAGAATGAALLGLSFEGSIEGLTPVTDSMLVDPDPDDWLMLRGNYEAWSYSELADINRGNVGGLRMEWAWALTEGGRNEPAPIVHDGILYVVNMANLVQALDGATGMLLWEHYLGPNIASGAMRGVAIYDDKLYVATNDARIVALDAATGGLVWDTTIGERTEGNYSNSSGPIVIKGKVISGLAN